LAHLKGLIDPRRNSRHLLVHRGEVPIPEQLELTRLVGFLLQYSESALSGDASAIETVLRHELTALVSQLASERAGIGRALA